ncbi:unnamed protein product [Symbiodinium natans]|uniref:Uncharacterized protein n=1 Tax=Symbiodinium natans TaxID=878477 RepID=A0A812LD34_9DINO|nr:unnamed protein product [Symbiodinium natans]
MVHDFRDYAQGVVERYRLWNLHGDRGEFGRLAGYEGIRSAILAAEDVFKDHVVLYKTISLYGWWMAWLAWGVFIEEPLVFDNSLLDKRLFFAPLQLRVFEDGNMFPSFVQNASVCLRYSAFKMVREADAGRAKLLGDGTMSYGFHRVGSKRKRKLVYVVHYHQIGDDLLYRSCHDLVYCELDDMNKRVAPLLTESELARQGIETGKQFAEYLDAKVGAWRDSQHPSHFDGLLATVGVPDRLMKANLNLLGSATTDAWQTERQSAWEQFLDPMKPAADLTAELNGHNGQAGDLGDRLPLLELMLRNSTDDVKERVRNLLSLLQCATFMRFRMKEAIMGPCWRGNRGPFPLVVAKRDLDAIASRQTKDAIRLLDQDTAKHSEDLGEGWSRVLLQMVFAPELADRLAYVSTNYLASDKSPGNLEPEYKNMSFTQAYELLKNRDAGDEVTVRVLMRQSQSHESALPTYVSHGKVFQDQKYMTLVQHVLNDMRATLLGEMVLPEPQPPWWLWATLGVLAAAVAAVFLRWRFAAARPRARLLSDSGLALASGGSDSGVELTHKSFAQ